MRPYLAPPPLNPVSRVLAGLLAVLALVGAFFFGLFVLALVFGLGLLIWLVLTLRMSWLRRRWGRRTAGRRDVDTAQPDGVGRRDGEVIEGDYEVISRRDED